MEIRNTETGVTAEVETDLNPPVCRNSMAQAVGTISLKIDRVYEATAKAMASAIVGVLEYDGQNEATAIRELAHDLADEYEKIDPAFDRHAFLAIADGD